jgi:hypothetical protein
MKRKAIILIVLYLLNVMTRNFDLSSETEFNNVLPEGQVLFGQKLSQKIYHICLLLNLGFLKFLLISSFQ